MKKVCNILFLTIFLLSICTVDVSAATESPCSWDNLYHNPSKILPNKNASGHTDEALVYEITKVEMTGDVLNLYGWAFNSVYDTELTGWGGPNGGNATVSLTWYPAKYGEKDFAKINDNEKVKMDVIFATPGNSSDSGPKYYDYTYINCFKTRDSNGERYCMDNKGGKNDSTRGSNNYGSATPQLRGGFKATINIKEKYENGIFKKGEEYRLRLEFGMIKKNGIEWGHAKDVGIYDELVGDEVHNYRFIVDDTVGKIEVSDLSKSAYITSDSVLPNGTSGHFCNNSPAAKLTNTTYFYQGREYKLGKNIVTTCRGPQGHCSSQSQGIGAANMYEILGGPRDRYNKIPNTSTNISYYVPVSLMELKGTVTLKIDKNEEDDDPGICEGDEIYYLYYFVEDGVPEDFKGNIQYNSIYKDAEILKKLNFASNLDFSDQTEGALSTKTLKKDFDKFYDNFWKAIESGSGYVEDDGKYYLVPSVFYKWKTGNGIGEKYTFQKDKGSDKNSYVPNYKKIDANTAASGLGYQLTVKDSADYSEKKNKPLSIKTGTTALAKDGMFKKFAVYRITVCRDEEKKSNCPDTVNQAMCVESDSGTTFVFNENDDKTTCTIPKGNNSGFVAIESYETRGYCTMACKEDTQGFLPTAKETAAGQYFKLDNYVPKIKANRTCVTTKLDYDKFDSDKKNVEPGLIKAYNVYRDWLSYYKNMVSRDGLTGTVGGGTMTCGTDANGDPVQQSVPVETYFYWEVDAYSGAPNGTYWGDKSEKYSGTCSFSCENGVVTANPCTGQTLSEYKKSVYDTTKGLKDSFDGLQDTYSDIFVSYNKCFNWAQSTTDTYTFGGGGGLEPPKSIGSTRGDHTSSYLYSFEPKVTFYYPDPDGSIFPVEYEYKYGTRDVDMIGFSNQKDFWAYKATPDNRYENGGAALDPDGNQYYIKCTGETCKESMKINIPIYKNGAVRRDESVQYTYHLPDVFTSVPSGRVTTKPTSSGTFLQLDKEAVPVNINTLAGTYNYQIKIADLKDKLRLSKEGNNPDDNFDKRFNGSQPNPRGALNAGENYVCHYKVVNDIYLPGPKKFNFFYRVVDTYDINPLNRTLGYNWTTQKATQIRKVIQEDSLSYETLTNSKDRDKFEFILTPVTMQTIRKYNAKQTITDDGYADWDLECADYGERVSGVNGYHCTSNFITCLAGGKGDNCADIIGDAHDNGDYTYEDLKHNRDLLIEKQNKLDGRG